MNVSKTGVHVKEFEILLLGQHKNTQGFMVYRVGEKLTGLIVISGRTGNISGLKLILKGRARSYWKELTDEEEKEIHFQDEQNCILVHVDLDIEQSIMSRKEYSFEFTLPHGLPSSYDGLYGDVTYSIRAELEMEGGAITRCIQKEFKLDGYLDLAAHPEVLEPVELDNTKHLLFGEGYLGVRAKLDKSGFLPGEMPYFNLRFTNQCNVRIQVNLFLLRDIIYHAGENKITHTEIVDTKQGPIVEKHAEREWNGHLLQIPFDAIWVLSNCRIMEMQYRFLIEMNIPGPHVNLEGNIPIVIGTVDSSRRKERIPSKGEDASPPVPEQIDQQDEKEPSKKQVKPASSKFRTRHQRSQTTINIFRPKPVRQVFPTPKPDTWAQPIVLPFDEVSDEHEDQIVHHHEPQPDEQKPTTIDDQTKQSPEEQENMKGQHPDVDETNSEQVSQDDDEGQIHREPVPDECEQEEQQQEQSHQVPVLDTDSKIYTGVIPPKDCTKKPKKSLPYPTFVDSNLLPKPIRKCLVNVFRVAENKILEPIGWRIRKSKCCLERVGDCCCHCCPLRNEQDGDAAKNSKGKGKSKDKGKSKRFVLPKPTVSWSEE